MQVIYEGLCPVCDGDLSLNEIEATICNAKRQSLCREDYEVEEFVSLFNSCVGRIRKLQLLWAKRVLRNESFCITSPTGSGKTAFGLAMSIFLAKKGKKCYLIFPTTVLVVQAFERINSMLESLKLNLKVGYYHGKLKKEEKEDFMKNIGNFNIIITSSQFLSKNFDVLKNYRFDFIFVDDVDAILKASRNVERILTLLGLNPELDGKNPAENKGIGCLVVSTATAKKGKKAELFRKLLNFDIGSPSHVRNIEDFVIMHDEIEALKNIMRELGNGGIIYTSSERIGELTEKLNEFRIGVVTSKKNDFEMFKAGEVDYLIGTAHYYGSLVRGLDLPEKIRYAIFVGFPVFKMKVEDIDSASENQLRIIARILGINANDAKLKEKIKEAMKKERIVSDVVVKDNTITFPDLRTYIQASGRTSRLLSTGLTKGASFVIEKDADLVSAIIKRARYYDIEFRMANLDEIDFDRLKREIKESRQRKEGHQDLIKPALLVVESPTKARQISRFFGKPSVKILDGVPVYEVAMEDYVLFITASIGHLTDLVTDRGFHGVEVGQDFIPVYASIKRCKSCGYQFTSGSCPKCKGEFDDSKQRILALRKLAYDTGFVIVGTDPDTEGEKIAWDIKNLLACGEIRRAEFHEVTKKAVRNAIRNLRDVDENLVKAQMFRRIEDRWIGFSLSEKLWKIFNNRNLSAGRAQTPVLGWIIDRFEKSKRKKDVAIIEDFGIFVDDSEIIKLLKSKLKNKKKVKVRIEKIDERVEERVLPPYTTESLLIDAGRILKIPAREAMSLAQDLFENGLITYHRTDSTRVSDDGLRVAKEYLGEDFRGRHWSSEGAHECIRPTKPFDKNTVMRLIEEGILYAEKLTFRHFALYDLIFRRFMASQSTAEIRFERYSISLNGKIIEHEIPVSARGRSYELYKSVLLREPLPRGEAEVSVKTIKIAEAKPLTQAEVVGLMRERKIGRPSTYATIIDKLFLRRYIFEKNGFLIPSRLGMDVFSYLSKNYGKFVSEHRTRELEEKMEEIEKGIQDYYQALKELYEEIKEIK
ncbi:Reverse gyrase [Archaeoglobus sulfaticallidus PM70-1]|uniref:Reverse gyrase n=1 Tax=Archaeoglobus sulfaticallidus PM70-1 TaxID=387631 RepID=N0BNH0_9EURY|nr:reverse gyrase [Archaeoglobus sulfaticallidus]AGK62206.1 Reverse gyrase [Archaeoglobus sulfaticallidus PM70-1]